MPAKPKGDMGLPQGVEIGGRLAYISEPKKTTPKIKIKVDTVSANRGVKEITKMFDRIRNRLIKMFIEYLESEEGQAAIKKAIREELKR